MIFGKARERSDIAMRMLKLERVFSMAHEKEAYFLPLSAGSVLQQIGTGDPVVVPSQVRMGLPSNRPGPASEDLILSTFSRSAITPYFDRQLYYSYNPFRIQTEWMIALSRLKDSGPIIMHRLFNTVWNWNGSQRYVFDEHLASPVHAEIVAMARPSRKLALTQFRQAKNTNSQDPIVQRAVRDGRPMELEKRLRHYGAINFYSKSDLEEMRERTTHSDVKEVLTRAIEEPETFKRSSVS